MEREFSLEAILTAITGLSCVDNFGEFFELVWFVFNDDHIGTIGLTAISETLRNHILAIHPQLRGIKMTEVLFSDEGLAAWEQLQKEKFGETLPVCQLGQTLSGVPSKGKSR